MGKIIVITGAAGLLGKTREGDRSFGGTPILIDLSQKKLDLISEHLNKKFKTDAVGYKLDITNEKDVQELSNKIFIKFGKVDGLVNNASNNPKLRQVLKIFLD